MKEPGVNKDIASTKQVVGLARTDQSGEWNAAKRGPLKRTPWALALRVCM